MSTFPGFIHEIPKISVDRFVGRNLKSEVFFLSHFHADHMVGLREIEFHTMLRKRESAFIYCSELTKLFLSQNHLQGMDDKIKVLPINKEQVISINDEHGFLSVTALPAGHCPGSIMFLFHFKGSNYLYTGDYRMTKENILNLKPLKNSDGSLKHIETLYLDTTFYQPFYSYFPTRDESITELTKLCRSWLEKGDQYVIDLRTPAIVGVEYVLISLCKEFKMPFHVSDPAYEKYCRIPDLSSAVTKDTNCRLHACIPGRACGKSAFTKLHTGWKEHNVLSVKLCSLSARYFSEEKDLVSYSENQSLYRVVYSSHSSHTELCEMIETLHPAKIEPCVVPVNRTPEQVVEVLQKSHQLQRNDSEEMAPLQFSSFEDAAGNDPDDNPKQEMKHHKTDANGSGALVTLSKYNVGEPSDEEECYESESEDELPPFRWDCYYNGNKALGFHKKERSALLPFSKQKYLHCLLRGTMYLVPDFSCVLLSCRVCTPRSETRSLPKSPARRGIDASEHVRG